MSRLVGSWPLLAASLLLGGCYVGHDLAEESASSSAGATVMTTSADPDTGATAADAGGSTTGAVDGSTSGDAGTSGPITSEPVTSGPVTTEAMSTSGASGDETTGAADTGAPPPVDVPDNAYCAAVGDWDPA